MSFEGVLIGVGTFLIIGLLHPVIIKVEYYIGKHIWPLFLVSGIICIALSVFVDLNVISILLAVLGFSLFWGIRELFEQEERVRKGWFPANSNKKSILKKKSGGSV
ncbi:MAG: DUF4491 family protein [Ruminiclostridium sp.]